MASERDTPSNSATANPAPIQHYREPRTFSAKAGEDFEEWLTHYERVSQYNNWNAASQLRNVFFLAGTALLWYNNHADMLTTWASLVEEMKCFGDSDAKKKRAESTLAQRAQVLGETCTTYIEEVLKLCKTINPGMSEDDKVGHLLKGIVENVYSLLIGKENLNTVSDVIRYCRMFEALKARRITPKFGRLPNVMTVASMDMNYQMDLSSAIRQIVREEILRHEEQARHTAPQCYSTTLQDTVCAAPSPTWQHSVNVTDFSDYRDEPHYYQTSAGYNDCLDQRPHNVHPRRPDITYEFQGDELRYSQPAAEVEHYQPEVRPLPVCYRCGTPGIAADVERQAMDSRCRLRDPMVDA